MRRAFSIFEVLIVVTIMAILLAIGLPLTIRFYQTYQMTTLSETTLNMLRSAQEKARSGLGQTGVHVAPDFVTAYRGMSYASRNQAFDEKQDIPSSIIPSGMLDFTFTIPLGRPQSIGTLTLRNSFRTDTISVNSQGLVERQ